MHLITLKGFDNLYPDDIDAIMCKRDSAIGTMLRTTSLYYENIRKTLGLRWLRVILRIDDDEAVRVHGCGTWHQPLHSSFVVLWPVGWCRDGIWKKVV